MEEDSMEEDSMEEDSMEEDSMEEDTRPPINWTPSLLEDIWRVGVRGLHARVYLSGPVRVGWLGTRFCRRVLLLSFFFLSSFFFFSPLLWRLKTTVFSAGMQNLRGGPGGPGGAQGGGPVEGRALERPFSVRKCGI